MVLRQNFGGYLINWVGGKRQLRETVSLLIPSNISSYIEPFGGGGWVLFYYHRWADLEVYNDLDNRLVNLFRVVKYHPCELAREMCYLFHSREQFLSLIQNPGETDIQKAARFMFVLSRSFGGRGKHFGVSYEGSIKSAGGLIERVDKISKRLDKVIIENLSAMDLIPQYDTENAFFYCDPPYSSGAGYEVVSAAKFEHERLRDTLKNIKGRFLLSYDDAPKIRELYKDFNIIETERINGINIKNNIYKELLICNYDVENINGVWQVKNNNFSQGSIFDV